ncbi:hypothetical protein OUZ56_000685 [Daphnia magna]|uniref:Ig-like domain-containing protein n=1 Tax=Daphnia magna TaxID=35525 RepID=A0ABR0A137_9CRUS|nr:hypothetical protein OUZ56_000685 [Daphnia magna]
MVSNLSKGDGQQQQQYFTERPQNTSVREGQMAVLRCKVGNQQGRAQWTKDGFALGKLCNNRSRHQSGHTA